MTWYSLRKQEVFIIAIGAFILLGSIIAKITFDQDRAPLIEETKSSAPEVKIDINTSTEGMLQVIPSIGKTTAENIIRERETAGPFASLDDLLKRVPRLRDQALQDFSPYLDFSTAPKNSKAP